MRHIDTIIVHHTVTSEYATAEDIGDIHAKRGISRPGGYHFLVSRDRLSNCPRVYGLRPVDKVGAHDKGQNSGSIGIAIAGDFTQHDIKDDSWFALCDLIVTLKHVFPTITKVEGHRDNEPSSTPTACPGFPAHVLTKVLNGAILPPPETDYIRGI